MAIHSRFISVFCLITFGLLILFQNTIFAQPDVKKKYKQTASGLNYKIIKKTKNEKLKYSQRVFITYDLYHQKDTSRLKLITKNAKKDFLLGHEEVLKGWDEGVSLLKVGDSALFKIPPQLAYGDKKTGTILPNSTIYLFVKVDSVNNAFYNHKGLDTLHFNSGLKKICVFPGKGEKAKPYQEVIIKFTAYVYGTKGHRQIFEESKFDSKIRLFQLGIGQFIKGLDEGITGMRVGEKATFIIPPYLGFGNNKAGKILPNTILYYDIELLDAKNPFLEYQTKQMTYTSDSALLYVVENKEGEFITFENIVIFNFKAYYKNNDNYNVLFDNSLQHLSPMNLRPGSYKTFPWIENALLKLKKGEKATLLIPEKLIENKNMFKFLKPGEFLYYDLYIEDVLNYQFLNLVKNDTITKTNGLKLLEVRSGDGLEIKKGDKIKIAYTIYVINNQGQRFIIDASREREKLLEFEVGAGANIVGLEEGVLGMNEGGLRRIIIPPSLAYGKEGVPERGIPANIDLIVDIEGIRIIKQ
jgi:FKBP-type peptidyl-prolyl cis-trans isomerase